MIEFLLEEVSLGSLNISINNTGINPKYTLYYPCLASNSHCTPYMANLSPGMYLFETWGAEGGESYSNLAGGKGGYSYGIYELIDTAEVYFYVGGKGSKGKNSVSVVSPGGFNGGGSGGVDSSEAFSSGGGGGGSSDIRIAGKNLNNRIIVAGGGGGAGGSFFLESSVGGAGGGMNGLAASDYLTGVGGGGGTQSTGGSSYSSRGSSPGTLLCGGSGSTHRSSWGGGGYFGGGGGSSTQNHVSGYSAGGGGGSGNIDGVIDYPDYGIYKTSKCGIESFLSPEYLTTIGHSGSGVIRISCISGYNNPSNNIFSCNICVLLKTDGILMVLHFSLYVLYLYGTV